MISYLLNLVATITLSITATLLLLLIRVAVMTLQELIDELMNIEGKDKSCYTISTKGNYDIVPLNNVDVYKAKGE